MTTNRASYLVDLLEEQITKRQASVNAHLDFDYLRSALKRDQTLPETALHNLLTLAMAVDEVQR